MQREPIPRLPVFGWTSLAGARAAPLPCLLSLPRLHYTTSGRASILLALRALGTRPGDRVLLPTYHCPTMVAPVARLQAVPAFYPIDDQGTPDLAWLETQDLQRVRVMLAAHFFGLPQPMARVRDWCDRHGIALIEDCAHALFGQAGARPIGAWGDIAIASLTKFLPVPEGGCLIANTAQHVPPLDPCGPAVRIKSLVDILEVGASQGRLAGFNGFITGGLAAVRAWRRARSGAATAPLAPPAAETDNSDFVIDPTLSHRQLAAPCRWVARRLPRARIVTLRRRNYEWLLRELSGQPGFRPLLPTLPADAAPYVFPLWVDRPDPHYTEMRRRGLPVFRWNRRWPDQPALPGDRGPLWSHHVLQLACHQDLSEEHLRHLVATIRSLCTGHPPAVAPIPEALPSTARPSGVPAPGSAAPAASAAPATTPDPWPTMSWQIIPGERFAEYVQTWDALQRQTTDTPFLERAFLQPALQEFGSGKELLALHHGAHGCDAAAIVVPAGRGMWQTFQPSQLPLGAWIATPEADLAGRLRSLVQALPGIGLGVGLTQLDPRLQRRPAQAPGLTLLDYVKTSHVEITGSFDDYWEARGKNLRQNTRKQRNKLQADGVAMQLDCITDAAAVAAAIDDYGRLESAGWKAGIGTAIHADNAQGRFYRRMLENFCAAGRGRIYRLRFGEQTVAMDLCIDNGPTVVILKTAYDESFRAVSPSTLMRHEQFRTWWAEGRYRRIEFYGKTMEWHTRWTEQERGLYHATLFRWPWLQGVSRQLKDWRTPAPQAATAAAAPQAVAGQAAETT